MRKYFWTVSVLCTCIVLLLGSVLCWWAELRAMLRHLSIRVMNGFTWAILTVQFTMYYTFSFYVGAVICQNNGQFLVWELNIWQFIVILEIKYFLNLNDYYLPIFILSIHFRQISFFKITKDIQSNNNNNIVLSMLYAEICPKFGRYNALPSSVRALCLLTLGHISAYNMNNTIVLYKYYITCILTM